MADVTIDRRAAALEHELQTRTDRLAAKLQDEFSTGDAKRVSDAMFYDIIRRNWSNQQWRAAQAERMGTVPFYKAALKAFGIHVSDHSASLPSIEPSPVPPAAPLPPVAPVGAQPIVVAPDGPPPGVA